jgi:putative sterol carrier protein
MSLEEYKKLVEKLETDMSKDTILQLIDMTKEVGFINIVKDDDLKDFLGTMREKIAELSSDDLKEIIPKFLPIMFGGMQELLDASEDAKDELEDMDDMAMMISVPDMNVQIFMKIEDGKFTAGEGEVDDPDLTIKMAEETFMKMATGDLDAMQAYMSGEVQLEGDMTKAMAIRPLMDILADEYEFDIGLMG